MVEQDNQDGKLPEFLEEKISELPNESGPGAFVHMPDKIQMALNVVDGKIVIAFRKPLKSLIFDRAQAINLANVLMSFACNIK